MTVAQPSVVRFELHFHNQAVNRYRFSGLLTLNQALHIGSGRGDETTDALVVTQQDGKPIIPGSSLRGVFRSAVERMLNGLDKGLWACQLYEVEPPGDQACIGNSVHKKSYDLYKELNGRVEKEGMDSIWKDLPKALCDACRLFGASTFWASKIRFTDLPLASAHNKAIRHGVGIHRDTGTAAPGVKYDKQVVEAGAQFTFEAIAENLDDNDLRLLALGFSLLAGGDLALGGSTGRGLGGCKLENGKVEWVDLKSELANYLITRKYPHAQSLSAWFEQVLSDWLKD